MTGKARQFSQTELDAALFEGPAVEDLILHIFECEFLLTDEQKARWRDRLGDEMQRICDESSRMS